MKNKRRSLLVFLLLAANIVQADSKPVSPEDVVNESPYIPSTPPPHPSKSPSPSPSTSPTSPSPSASPSPSMPPATPIDACYGKTIGDLLGMIGDQHHDGVEYNFNPFAMNYNSSLGLWYADDHDSTWVCQKRSIAQPVVGRINIVDAGATTWYRTPINGNSLTGRLVNAHNILSSRGEQACFVCGLIRRLKGCFPPGVQIATKDAMETIPVEKVKVGDELWNPLLKKNKKVLRIVEGPEQKSLIAISVGKLKLTVSSEHPVLTERGLKQANEISIGDVLFDGNGEKRKIDKIEALPVVSGQTVINFVMEESGEEYDGQLLVEGLVVGDLKLQKSLVKNEKSN